LLLPLAFILHLGSFIRKSIHDPIDTGVFSDALSNFTYNNPGTASILTVFIIFFSAVMINRLAILNRLSNKISLFPGAIYIVMVSLLPVWKGLSLLTLCSLGVILLLTNIGYSGNRYKVEDKIFNIGFFAGLLFLLYPPSVLFILLGIIGMSILRPYKQREYLNLLNGFILPHFLAAVYFIWNGQFNFYWQETFIEGLEFWNIPEMNTRDIIFSSFWVLALLISLVGYPKFTMKKEIQARKKIDIMYWSLLLSFGILFISPKWDIQIWFIVAPALAFLLSESLINMSNELLSDMIYTFLFIAALTLQFVNIPG
jgi:hypothetical protein